MTLFEYLANPYLLKITGFIQKFVVPPPFTILCLLVFIMQHASPNKNIV